MPPLTLAKGQAQLYYTGNSNTHFCLYLSNALTKSNNFWHI